MNVSKIKKTLDEKQEKQRNDVSDIFTSSEDMENISLVTRM